MIDEPITSAPCYPEYTYQALARCLLPKIKRDFDNENWQRDFQAYKEKS